ncbi:MAG: cyclic nucleotide-binding domain-containing protein [Saccharospirillaceae bacterium]|nr:cyclic nucleotide-binding domain-containing protein [Saccharospirillaceae bacterium]MCD8530519.1 cyclic nucleotide-binding domain-containing protein [Saccharospirillaceae bacterium]
MKKASSLSRNQVIMVLGKIPFFRAFTLEERERMADEQGHFHVALSDEYIIRQGSCEHAFYILLSGGVHVEKEDVESVITRLIPGDVFGEIGFLADETRTSHVIADEPSIVLRIDRVFMARQKPEVREKIKDQLIALLIRRLLDQQGSHQ